MAYIDDLRKQYPNLAGYNDGEIADIYAKKFGIDKQEAFTDLGVKVSKGLGGDTWRGFKQGVEQIPGMLTGVADIVPALTVGKRPFTTAADYLGEKTGFQPGKWSEALEETKSAGYQQGRRNIDAAWDSPDTGPLDILGAYAKNPGVSFNNIVQSLPGMVAGGVAGRVVAGVGGRAALGLGEAAGGIGPTRAAVAPTLERVVGEKWAVPIAAGVGEGGVTTGQQMDQYKGDNQQLNAAASLAAGLGTGAIGAAAGRVARALGLETAETAIAGRLKQGEITDLLNSNTRPDAPMGAVRRIGGGALSEGVLQEYPQSFQEQVWQNLANEKPILEGANRAGVEGAIAGAAMGGGANLRNRDTARADFDRSFNQRQAEFDNPGGAPQPNEETRAILQENERRGHIDHLTEVLMRAGATHEAAAKQAEKTFAARPQGETKRALTATELEHVAAIKEAMPGASAAEIEKALSIAGLSTKPVKPTKPGAAPAPEPKETKADRAAGKNAERVVKATARVETAIGDALSTGELDQKTADSLADLWRASADKSHGAALKLVKQVKDVARANATKATVLPKSPEQNLQDQAHAAQAAKAALPTVPQETQPAAGVPQPPPAPTPAAVSGLAIPSFTGGENGNSGQGVRAGGPEAQQTQNVPGAQTKNAAAGPARSVQATQTAEITAPKSEPPPKPASAKNVAELAAYKAKMQPWLTSTLTNEEIQAVAAVHGAAKDAAGDEEVAGHSLRAAAESLGVSHTEVANRAKRADEKIAAAALKAGITLDTAHELLGMQSSADVMDITGTNLLADQYTGRSGNDAATSANDDFDHEHGANRDETAAHEGETPEDGNAAETPDATVDAIESGFNVTGAPMDPVTGEPAKKVDIEDAMLMWVEKYKQPLPPPLIKGWVQLYLSGASALISDRTFNQIQRDYVKDANEYYAKVEAAKNAESVGLNEVPSGDKAAPADAAPKPAAKPAPRKRAAKTKPKPASAEVTWAKAWDEQVAGPAGVAPWSKLTESQRFHLTSAGTNVDAQAAAVDAVVRELQTKPTGLESIMAAARGKKVDRTATVAETGQTITLKNMDATEAVTQIRRDLDALEALRTCIQ